MSDTQDPTAPKPVIPTRPPPPPPKAPDPTEIAPPDGPTPSEEQEPRSAPAHAPSRRESGRHRLRRPTPPGGAPIVLDRGRSATGYTSGGRAGLHASGYTAVIVS